MGSSAGMGHLEPLGPSWALHTQTLALAGHQSGGVWGARALPGDPCSLQRRSWPRGPGDLHSWWGPALPLPGRHSPWVVAVLHGGEAHALRARRSREGQHQALEEAPHFAEVAAAYGRGAVEQEDDVRGVKARAGHCGERSHQAGPRRSRPPPRPAPPAARAPCAQVPGLRGAAAAPGDPRGGRVGGRVARVGVASAGQRGGTQGRRPARTWGGRVWVWKGARAAWEARRGRGCWGLGESRGTEAARGRGVGGRGGGPG